MGVKSTLQETLQADELARKRKLAAKEAREGAEWIGSTGIRGALERVGLATYLFTGIQPATLFISADLMICLRALL